MVNPDEVATTNQPSSSDRVGVAPVGVSNSDLAMRGYGYHVWTKGEQTLWCSCSVKKDHTSEPRWEE